MTSSLATVPPTDPCSSSALREPTVIELRQEWLWDMIMVMIQDGHQTHKMQPSYVYYGYLVWLLILYIDLAGPWCPDIWSNILNGFVKVFLMRLTFKSVDFE